MERNFYVLIDEQGETSEEFNHAGEARDEAIRLKNSDGSRHAVAERVYDYSHEKIVEWPEGADTEWPPSEEAQDTSARRFVR